MTLEMIYIYLFIVVIVVIEIILIKKSIKKKREKKNKSLYSKNIIVDKQESKKCSGCGNEIESGMIFCDKCGTRIN